MSFTKLYLWNVVPSGTGLTYPSTKQASGTQAGTGSGAGFGIRTLGTTKQNAPSANNSIATASTSAQGKTWIGTFCTPQLAGQTVGGTLSVGFGITGPSGQKLDFYVYVWRPSSGGSKVGELVASAGSVVQSGSSISADGNTRSYLTTLTLSSLGLANGDIICVEVWADTTAAAGGISLWYGGSGTEPTVQNATLPLATDPASYVTFSQTLYAKGELVPLENPSPVSFVDGVDFGTDIATFPDLDETLTLQRGSRILLDALARRLITPRGLLWAFPDYGRDIRQYLNAAITSDTLHRLKADLEAELLQDERVTACNAIINYNPSTQRALVSIQVATAQGPFSLVLAVTAVTVDILSASEVT